MKNRLIRVVLMIAASTQILGCSPKEHRLSEKEWEQVFSMPADNTQTAKTLVEHDARSREAWLSIQQDLESQRMEIGNQRDQLESDRRVWSERSRNDTIISETVTLFVAALPLLLVAFLLWPRKADPPAEEVNEILIADLVDSPPRIDPDTGARRLEDPR